MTASATDFSGNIERFTGFADLYDRYRPHPPAALAEILTRMIDTRFPSLIVDLGSGTGLSTRYWSDKAKEVIGIEPTADMRQQAKTATQAGNVSYLEGFSHATGLPDACAQIVTASQSLHWMDPQPTFDEVHRILQTGGVFAAFDYDWPPTTGKWEADKAFEEVMRRSHDLQIARASVSNIARWQKTGHLERMQLSGRFRYTKEILLHHVESGNAERLTGLAFSQGGVMTLIKAGISETELGLAQLKAIALRTMGTGEHQWFWSSRVRIAVK